MKMRPFTSARSTGMSRSRAKWLSVPSGNMPSRVLVPATAPATQLMVPSPPPAITSSAPLSTASFAASTRSQPSRNRRSPSIPASASALSIAAFSPTDPPPRLMRIAVFTRGPTREKASGLLARTFADPPRVDGHLHAHAVSGRTALRGHVHLVALRRIGAGHLHDLRRAALVAMHLRVDLAAAHPEM